MEQEALDARMTDTGTVPVTDRLPSVGNGERASRLSLSIPATVNTDSDIVKTHKVTREEEDEEAELAKLQAEMAM